ncbi:hypothetical protein [Methylobacterium sp. CCH5-D2]|uniref:DUF7940 domain-containing protein n=1 Tax=Methylobacterium sp. CCH5-D2 TaxID=1768765 RepID=UPI000833430B|nr:hypothetical protein [Methylobacterium sp. CCH5-D2]
MPFLPGAGALARPLAALRARLVANWREVAARSWSLHLMGVSGALQSVYLYWPNLDVLPWWSSLAVLAAAMALRFVAQRGLSLPATVTEEAA